MSHILSSSDLKGFKFEHQIAGSFGKKDCKELLAVVTPETSTIEYLVSDHRQIVFSGSNIEDAIRHYNEI